MRTQSILLVDFNPRTGWGENLNTILGAEQNLSVRRVAPSQPVDEQFLAVTFKDSPPDATFLCFEADWFQFGRHIIRPCAVRSGVLIVVSDIRDSQEVDVFLSHGVAEVLVPPVRKVDVIPRLRRLLSGTQSELSVDEIKAKLGLQGLVGQSAELLAVLKKLPSIGHSDASALITGETGTGKELCARAIHNLSVRSKNPFIPVNCGALPLDLVENELFGHDVGAFTGATTAKPGLIKEADGGTLFLDEIDSLPLSAQVKVLRFLQEGEFRPLGSSKSSKSDVRIIAASNTNVENAVHQNRFRADLYYRLAVVVLNLPPLRSRSGDISLLTTHFLRKFARQVNKSVPEVTAEARDKILQYDWPGNVRELENIIRRAVILSDELILQASDIELPTSINTVAESFRSLKAKAIAAFERKYIQELLASHHGNITSAAKAAQKNRRAFWGLMRKHGIDASPMRRASAP